MTIRELIAHLEACDEEMKDFTIGAVVTATLSGEVRFSVRCDDLRMPKDGDRGQRILWLKGKN